MVLHTALQRHTTLVVISTLVVHKLVISGLVYDAFQLCVFLKELLDAHLAEFCSFDQDHFGDGGCLLSVLVCLDVLA